MKLSGLIEKPYLGRCNFLKVFCDVKVYDEKSSRIGCRMAYLLPRVTRGMLLDWIAMPATISTTAIMNMASLMSTTTKEFTENPGKVVTASEQQQQRAITTTSGEGGARNK
jgi:hypothetical protein